MIFVHIRREYIKNAPWQKKTGAKMVGEWFTDLIKPEFDSFSSELNGGDTWLYVREIVG